MDELWSNIHIPPPIGNQTTTTTTTTNHRSLPTWVPPDVGVSLSLSSSSSSVPIQLNDHQQQQQKSLDHHEHDNDVMIENEIGSPSNFISSLNSPFEALASNSLPMPSLLLSSSFCRQNKRTSEELSRDQDSKGDRRYKRMMKNRESAARSRARRQAYTSELEREVAQLMEENAKLREEQKKQLMMPCDGAKIPEKPTHTRSWTAPF